MLPRRLLDEGREQRRGIGRVRIVEGVALVTAAPRMAEAVDQHMSCNELSIDEPITRRDQAAIVCGKCRVSIRHGQRVRRTGARCGMRVEREILPYELRGVDGAHDVVASA